MASATGIPQHYPVDSDTDGQVGDTEPLLGRPGDASQGDDAPIIKNLVLGMMIIMLSIIAYSSPVSRIHLSHAPKSCCCRFDSASVIWI